MFDVKFPAWLERFHKIVALADAAALLKARLRERPANIFEQQMAAQRGEQAPTVVIEAKEDVLPWLDSVAAATELDATAQQAMAGVTGSLRQWIANPTQLWQAQRYLEDAEAEIRKAASAIIATRSADDRGLAFMSEFYVADQRSTGAIIGARAQAPDLGSDGERMLRLAQECEYAGLLEEMSVLMSGETHYRITVAGRKWVEEQIQGPKKADSGPWWMRSDDPNQKWENLGSKRVYDRDVADAVSTATADQPLSLLFIDFDNLKKTNSEHGNPQADRLLRAVIDVIALVVDGKGRPYLHGNGDEFAVLLPNSSIEEATATAQRICAGCRQIAIAGLPTPSVSIGVATLPLNASDAAGLEEAANAAQRIAKEQGKDRAVPAPGAQATGRSAEG